MSHHPLRRRDRGGRLDEDYIAAGDSPYYDTSRAYSPRGRDDSPPRRDRTRRSRRPASPELYAPQPRYESPPPTRTRSTRDPPRYGGDSPPRRRRSPPPAYAPDSSRRNRGDAYDRDGYGGGGYASRGRYDDPEPRSRRPRGYSLSPERRARGGRDRPPPAFDSASPPRRHRSSAGHASGYGAARGASPPPMRSSRPPPATAGRPPARGGRGPQARRNSMPAATGADGAAKKAGWWTNPLIQASARTAFTAGAQAAMSSRKDKGPWIGPKGAKVASAALMGGFMDGFMGSRNGGGEGGRDRGGAPPPQSNMKSDLMREGMMAALGRFGSKR